MVRVEKGKFGAIAAVSVLLPLLLSSYKPDAKQLPQVRPELKKAVLEAPAEQKQAVAGARERSMLETAGAVSREIGHASEFAGSTRVEFERTAWFNDFISKHARAKSLDENLLTALIAQESRGTMLAKSPAGASGLAQLMKGAAKEGGLNPVRERFHSEEERMGQKVKVGHNNVITNPRFDPDASIGAAAGLLKHLVDHYDFLGEQSHLFALAAYNTGKSRVDNAIWEQWQENKEEFGKTRSFLDLAGAVPTWSQVSERLSQQTRDYVHRILAKKVLLEEKNHFREHGITVPASAQGAYSRLLENTVFKAAEGASLEQFAKREGVKLDQLRLLNPQVLQKTALGGFKLRVPADEKRFGSQAEYFEKMKWNKFWHAERGGGKPCPHYAPDRVRRFMALR